MQSKMMAQVVSKKRYQAKQEIQFLRSGPGVQTRKSVGPATEC